MFAAINITSVQVIIILSAIFSIIFLATLFYQAFVRALSSDKLAARSNALYLSKEEWTIKGGMINPISEDKNEVVLELQSKDFKRKFVLPFRAGHPDIEALGKLEQYDLVSFDYLPECLPCALPIEENGYLRLKVA